MKNLMRIALLVFLVVSLVGMGGGNVAAAPGGGDPKPVVTLTADGLVLDWQVPPAEFITGEDGTVNVRIPGVELESIPGQEQLPVLRLLVALPPGGTPTLSFSNKDISALKTAAKLALEPRMQKAQRRDGTTYEVDAAPEKPVKFELASLEEVGIMRGVRLARLVLHPVLYENGQLKAFSHIKLALNFNAPLQPSAMNDDAILQQVREMVINPGQVQTTLADGAVRDALAPLAPAGAPTMVMEIKETGIYQVTYQALANAGFFANGGVDPAKLHLTHAGQEVAFEWVGDGNASFDSNELLRFYAKPRTNRWANFDAYFLSVQGTNGTRMTTRSAAPTGAPAGVPLWQKVIETNAIYMPDAMYFDLKVPAIDIGRDGDWWMWDALYFNNTYNYGFTLENINPALEATLTVYLNGRTTSTTLAPDHIVDVAVNGLGLGSMQWDGYAAKAQSFIVPAGRLAAAGNTLTLSVPNRDYDASWLDAFAVSYTPLSLASNVPFAEKNPAAAHLYTVNLAAPGSALAYDVSAEHAPIKLTGLSVGGSSVTFQGAAGQPAYLVSEAPRAVPGTSATLRQQALLQAASVKYLVIAPPAFLGNPTDKKDIWDLVTHRQNNGLTAAVENAQAIYDAYGQGLPNPQSIQDYLKALTVKPEYVLLVGDGTWDPKRYLANSSVTFIPPFLKSFEYFDLENAADNRFATLDGATDILADLMIGRLPVNSDVQLAAMVQKIIDYETKAPDGSWRLTGTIVADHPIQGDYNFYNAANALFTAMRPSPMAREKIYYQSNYPSGAATRTAIINAFNKGTSVMAYFGHSSVHQWGGKSPNELFFHLDNVANLQNGLKLPILLELTCYTSQFQMPHLDALDEAMVRSAAGGAIATFGSAGPGFTGSHIILGKGFIKAMQSGTATAGQGVKSAKNDLLLQDPNNTYLADTFVLLGDPALKLQMKVVSVKSMYLPVITR